MSTTVTETIMKEPAWEQSRTAWIEPGTHLQVPVPCKQGKLLRIEFDVLYGIDVDFLVMFEGVDGTVISLYGPTRRARGVTTVLEVPSEGEAYVTFDNINSWFKHKLISYTITFANSADTEVESSSRMRFGRALVSKPKYGTDGEGNLAEFDAGDYTDVRVAAGTQEDVELKAFAGSRLNVDWEVLEGRDIDFGITMVPDDDTQGPITIYGPSRRSTKLATSIPINMNGTIHMGFDTSYTWISSKLIRYSACVVHGEVC